MVGGRAIAVAFSFAILGFGITALPASACHESGDLCLPCPDETDYDCGHIGSEDDVKVLVRFVTSALPDEPAPERLAAATNMASAGGSYVVVSFEWDTPDHTAPAGHRDVPFHIELTSDDAEL